MYTHNSIYCAEQVPPETEFTVEVYLRPAGVQHNMIHGIDGAAGANSSLAQSGLEHGYPDSAPTGLRSITMRWSLLSAAYESELEDLVLGDFDLSVLPRSALSLDWKDHAVQHAAMVLGLAPNGDDWRNAFGTLNAAEGDSVGDGADAGPLQFSPRDQGDASKAGVEGAVWSALTTEEKEAAKLLGWREQADDRSWVEGAIRKVGTEHIHYEGALRSPHTPLRAPETAIKAEDSVVTNQLCFGKRRASAPSVQYVWH